ncbi:hypothetical protein GQ54DRAFT_300240 [Martensiomyces pterosporus]|nr:hypothetical protein GQ54DRAFT_300240 [Martensiomyces pterosporus]
MSIHVTAPPRDGDCWLNAFQSHFHSSSPAAYPAPAITSSPLRLFKTGFACN